MATHSSILAWRIPWTEEPGRLWPIAMQRVRHDQSDLAHTHTHPSWPNDYRCIFKKFLFYVRVSLTNSVVLVSGVQQSDSVIHEQVSILFQICSPFRLLQSIEQSSLCCTVGLCWLSILNIVVCVCTVTLFLVSVVESVTCKITQENRH